MNSLRVPQVWTFKPGKSQNPTGGPADKEFVR
jgi:hypothetical protein